MCMRRDVHCTGGEHSVVDRCCCAPSLITPDDHCVDPFSLTLSRFFTKQLPSCSSSHAASVTYPLPPTSARVLSLHGQVSITPLHALR